MDCKDYSILTYTLLWSVSSLYDLGMSLSNGINGDVTSQMGSPMNESNTSIDISSDA